MMTNVKELRILREKNLKIIKRAVCCIEYCRRQEYYNAMLNAERMTAGLMEVMDRLLLFLPELGAEEPFSSVEMVSLMLQQIQDAESMEDYVFLADLLESSLLPFFMEYQQRLCDTLGFFIDEERFLKNLFYLKKIAPWAEEMLFGISVSDICERQREIPEELMERIVKLTERTFKKGYIVEYTADGNYTIALEKQGERRYLYTNHLMARESFCIADEWLGEVPKKLLCYGFGLGYPYEMLLELDDNIEIKVVEGDLNLIFLAVVFSDMAALGGNLRFSLEIDRNHTVFFEEIERGGYDAVFISVPILKNMRSIKMRERLEEYYIKEESYRSQRKRLLSNFKSNCRQKFSDVWGLKDDFQGKDLYIVAAGPSLEKNAAQLLNIDRNRSVILAVGTSLNVLLAEKIIPDYVIISDAAPWIYEAQLHAEHAVNVPLLFLATASSRAVKEYRGEKYIIYQRGFRESEDKAAGDGVECFESGGSVVTVAMDIGIRFGCRRLIFLGLDLAYADGKSHVGEAGKENSAESEQRYWTEDIYGNRIQTRKNWNIYRHWIEWRVAQMRRAGDDREVIDATEGGARIAGLKIIDMAAVLESATE